MDPYTNDPDVTEQRRTEQQRNVRLAVTQALSEAVTVGEGAAGRTTPPGGAAG